MTAPATRPTRPAAAPSKRLRVPAGNPDDITVNPATDTVYVATITSSGPDLVSVFNGATCNATDTVGCSQTPATLAVGSSGDAPNNSSLNLAVNPATNTIYASNVFNSSEPPPFLGNTVYVINGATCDAAEHDRLRPDPSHRHDRHHPPGRIQPLGNRGRPSHRHDLHREHRRRRDGRHRVGHQRRDLQRPEHQRLRPDPRHRPRRLWHLRHRGRPGDQPGLRTEHRGHQRHHDQRQHLQRHQRPRLRPARTRAIVGDYPGAISGRPAAGTAYVADSEGVSVIPLNH